MWFSLPTILHWADLYLCSIVMKIIIIPQNYFSDNETIMRKIYRPMLWLNNPSRLLLKNFLGENSDNGKYNAGFLDWIGVLRSKIRRINLQNIFFFKFVEIAYCLSRWCPYLCRIPCCPLSAKIRYFKLGSSNIVYTYHFIALWINIPVRNNHELTNSFNYYGL